MKLDYEKNNKPIGSSLMITLITAILAIAVVFVIVLFINLNQKEPSSQNSHTPEPQSTPELVFPDDLISNSDLLPEDLNFWDKYPEETEEPEIIQPSEKPAETPSPATDGKHFMINLRSGAEEYITISSYVPKNQINTDDFALSGQFMRYYEGKKITSKIGAFISEDQSYVDYNAIKKAGIQFVMICVGNRGYSTGNITGDSYMYDNIKRASDANIPVGVYFVSNAINTKEAEEEADYILDIINGAEITYPICLYFDHSVFASRIDSLKVAERTEIIQAFAKKIRDKNYIPMIYEDEEGLSLEINLAKLTDLDICLNDLSDLPKFPYVYSMWNYTASGEIDGISGEVPLVMSFIDFFKR